MLKFTCPLLFTRLTVEVCPYCIRRGDDAVQQCEKYRTEDDCSGIQDPMCLLDTMVTMQPVVASQKCVVAICDETGCKEEIPASGMVCK